MTQIDPSAPQTIAQATLQPMAEACPKCGQPDSLQPFDTLYKQCRLCHWKGVSEHYTPPPREVDHAHAAMPDDITCAYHPNKKATHICAGTGSYICTLCMLEIDGEIYSAEYVNQGGLEKAKKKTPYDRVLQRPDHTIGVFTFLSIFPYCAPLFPLWIGVGIYQFVRHRRMMRENETYAHVTRPYATIFSLLLLLAVGLLWLGVLVAIGVGVVNDI